MKVFRKKGVIKLIAALCVFLTLFNFMATTSYAEDGDDDTLLGKLGNAVMSLFVGIGDGIMSFTQKTLIGQDTSIFHISPDHSWFKWITTAGVCLLTGAITIGITIFSAGTLTPLALKGCIAFSVAVAGTYNILLYSGVEEVVFSDDFHLPLYNITPYEIFSNKIYLLDANFFDPQEDDIKYKEDAVKNEEGEEYIYYDIYKNCSKIADEGISSLSLNCTKTGLITYENIRTGLKEMGFNFEKEKGFDEIKMDVPKAYETREQYIEEVFESYQMRIADILSIIDRNTSYECSFFTKDEEAGNKNVLKRYYIWDNNGEKYYFYCCYYNSDYYAFDYSYFSIQRTHIKTEQVEIVRQSTAKRLQGIVSKWYTILRNIAIVVLLSVLVYVGIRMLLCSVAADKAKYKKMLLDWFIALCLLFVMHYIMSFAMMLTEKIINIIDSIEFDYSTREVVEKNNLDTGKVINGIKLYEISDEDQVEAAWEQLVENGKNEENEEFKKYFYKDKGLTVNAEEKKDAKYLMWPAENFMQLARMEMQKMMKTTKGDKMTTYESIGWKIIYCVLIIYTIIFLFTYIKRVIYLAFLTMIAPLVAMTYPIDKLNDGKAQAFDKWFKEYIFNLLIQPFHLLLYSILISTAINFAADNPLYVIVALGFMIPAEKLLRKFFGFDKADTPGLLAGAAGGALMMAGLNKLLRKPHHKGGEHGSSVQKDKEESNNIRQNSSDPEYDKYSEFKDGNKDLVDSKSDFRDDLTDEEKKKLKFAQESKQQAKELIKNSTGSDKEIYKGLLDEYEKDIDKYRKPKIKDSSAIKDSSIGSKIGGASSKKRHGKIGRFVIGGARKNANKFARYVKSGKPIKSFVRTGSKIITGAAGASVGLAGGLLAGIVTGDPSKAASYMATGGFAGYHVTDGIGESISNWALDDEARKKRKEERVLYADGQEEYSKYKREQATKSFARDLDNITYMEQHLGINGKEAKKLLEEYTPDCINAGISNIEDMAVIARYRKEHKEISKNEAINRMTIANEIGAHSKALGSKEYDDKNKKLSRIFGDEKLTKRAFDFSDEMWNLKEQMK